MDVLDLISKNNYFRRPEQSALMVDDERTSFLVSCSCCSPLDCKLSSCVDPTCSRPNVTQVSE